MACFRQPLPSGAGVPVHGVDRGAREARDTTGRMLASTGDLTEIWSTLSEPLLAVSCDGVLAGLPMLLQEGLLGRAREFLS